MPGNFTVGPHAGISETTQHTADAIAGGKSPILTRGVNGSPPGWYNKFPPCLGRPLGTSCDEYPYMSTVEGGVGASLSVVEPAFQNKQGGDLSAFYGFAGCNVQVGTKYGVIPVTIPFMPTARICSP
jgi:hypothetical protein